MNKLIAYIEFLSLKKLFAISFVLGGLSALGFAPFFLIPLTLLSFTLFFFILCHYPFLRARRAFWTGWFFGLGFFMVGLYWIALALHVDWYKFGWLFPFALVGVPAIGAFYPATVTYLTHLVKVEGVLKLLAFGVFWSMLEWVRGHIVPLFPWLLISDIWLFSPQISQSLSVVGSYGLGLLTIYLVILPALARKELMLGGLCVITAMWFAGQYRLNQHPTEYQPDLLLYLVQPNIKQEIKWDPEHLNENLQKLYAMSQNQHKENLIIVWPESAVTVSVESEGNFAKQAATLLKPGDYLAFGEPRVTLENGFKQVFNSFAVINQQGKIVGMYDKSRLVPFGEYVPLRSVIPDWIAKISYGSLDYSAGKGKRTTYLPHVPGFSPLVCYEIIFPGSVIPNGSCNTEWILNITNDGWYMDSSGPYQHFHMARARAIEEGLPVVRVANTGISAIIDPVGRVLRNIPYGVEGVIVEALPKPIVERTLYSFWRDIPYLLTVIFILALVIGFAIYRFNDTRLS